jgi:hypothetical protein
MKNLRYRLQRNRVLSEKGAELVCFFLTIILKLFVAFLDEPSFGQFLLPAQPNYSKK